MKNKLNYSPRQWKKMKKTMRKEFFKFKMKNKMSRKNSKSYNKPTNKLWKIIKIVKMKTITLFKNQSLKSLL